MRGPKVFKGYWRDPDATAAAFTGGWFHTGDIGVRDDGGYLFIVDRLKDMIVSGGENIASSEIERVLYEHDAVPRSGRGRPSRRAVGRSARGVRGPAPGTDVTADALIAHCQGAAGAVQGPQRDHVRRGVAAEPFRQGAQARAPGRRVSTTASPQISRPVAVDPFE